MNDAVVSLGSAAAAVVLAVWAGILALAQEAPSVPRSLGAAPDRPGHAVPFERALQISRLALVFVAAAAASVAVAWWTVSPLRGVASAVVSLGFLYMAADVVPRAVGILLPQLARAAARAARGTLFPFRPLLGLVGAVERTTAFALPASTPDRPDLGEDERDMLVGVVSLRDTTVAEVMTPRLDIAAIEADGDWHAVADHLRRSEHARIPVYRRDVDDIVGVLYAKDLMPAIAGFGPRPDHWQALIRPPLFVPESKSLAAQLRDFQRGSAHIALVVDEFGGTSGLVTLEDVLEEVVGEIYGEYDRDERPPVMSEGDDRFWIEGTVTLDTLSETLKTEIVREDVSTVGGLVYSELGRVPRPGEELRIAGFRVVVERVVRRRVERVYFERRPDEIAQPEEVEP